MKNSKNPQLNNPALGGGLNTHASHPSNYGRVPTPKGPPKGMRFTGGVESDDEGTEIQGSTPPKKGFVPFTKKPKF